MPGSKTYTSNKVNELLEAEFIDSINSLEKQRLKSISTTLFGEIIKVSVSLLVATLINLLMLSANASSENKNSESLWLELQIIAICILIFILVYLTVNGFVIISKWLFDALFNKRLFSAEKKKGYLNFHKKIVNHIYFGISFENKYNMYISRATSEADDLNLDLATNYLSQSVHYFKIAKEELQELIPQKNSGALERRNAEFMDFIGFPLINISLISGQRSLNRLIATEQQICDLAKAITAESNGGVIKQAYFSSITDLYSEIKTYISRYEDFLERAMALQILIEKQND